MTADFPILLDHQKHNTSTFKAILNIPHETGSVRNGIDFGRDAGAPALTRVDVTSHGNFQFASETATLGQAAKVAGMSQTEFLRELGRHRVPIHYGADDLAEDLRTVELLTRR